MLRRAVALHPPDCRRLALVMGASTLGQRFIVLPIPVLIRGCAIPVAWRIVRATAEGAWQPQWEALVRQRHGSAPDDWAIIVAADRDLYATRLFQAITARGWHPFVRIRRQRTSLTPMAHVRQPANRIRTRPGKNPAPERGKSLGSIAAQPACAGDTAHRRPWPW